MENTMQIELWDDANEPQAKFMWHVYKLQIPHNRTFGYRSKDLPFVYVSVDHVAQIQLEEPTYWFGQDLSQMSYDTRREIYEWLVEWEYAQWINIGPEDRELFATEKLIGMSQRDWAEQYNKADIELMRGEDAY